MWAPDVVTVVLKGAVVRALVALAGCLAALVFLAFVAITLDVLGVVDRIVAVGALHGVAVFLLLWC